MAGFEDLLPAEIASSRRQGPAPMRPGSGGSPPRAQRTAATSGGSPPRVPAVPLHAAAAAAAAMPAELACSVDGVPDSVVDAWFREADADGDGRVADSEARTFFLTSGLAPQDLSKIWQLVKSPEVIAREGKGLSRYRFAQVLRLIALAQSSSSGLGSGYAFTPENTTAALHSGTWLALHGVPLPPPRIGSAAQQQAAAAAAARATSSGNPFAGSSREQQHQQLPASSVQQPAAVAAVGSSVSYHGDDLLGADLLLGSAPAAMPAGAPPAASAHGPGTDDADDDDLFGLKALQERAASHGAVSTSNAAAAEAERAVLAQAGTSGSSKEDQLPQPLAATPSSSRSSTLTKAGTAKLHTNPLAPPVAFEARLPPLQPKTSAKLTMLAAGNGSLFAGPAVNGGLLQWGRPEGNMRRPQDVEGEHGQQGKLGRLMSDLATYTSQSHVSTEDPDAAPCIEVAATERGRSAECLMVDEAAALLWVADKEGWVYAYDIGGEACMPLRAAHHCYKFQAHRVGYVTAMCRTPQGELWTGSSRGNIRVWELGEAALVGEAPEPPLRCRELRKGYGERAHSGTVLRLVCPADGQLVWSASAKGLLLWDAACGAFMGSLQRAGGGGGGPRGLGSTPSQGDLLASGNGLGGGDREAQRFKVDGSQGLELDPIGIVVARPPSRKWAEIAEDQEAWAAQTDNNINELMERVSIGGSKMVQGAGKAVKLLGKLAGRLSSASPAEPPKASATAAAASLRQPSATSLMAPVYAADEEVSQSGSDSVGGIVELLVPPDGSVWVAHKCGTVDRYTAVGKRLGSSECGASLTAAACVGQRVWLGFSDGMISVRDASCANLKVFQAHSAGLLSIVQAGSRTFSLAADGSLMGWNSAAPHPADAQALESWGEQAGEIYRRESLRVLCVTWNVGESKPPADSPFFQRLHEAAFNTQLVVVGLQEIEMGSSSVALAAAKDAFSQRMQERGNTNAKFWSGGVLSALGGERHWHQVGLRQLSGMLIMVFARSHLKGSIGEVTTASVACGVLGVGGNKGAVAVEFSVHRRKVAVVCSHFAAHQGAVEARNANYTTICKQLTFSRRAWFADEPESWPASLLAATAGAQQAGAGAGDVDSDADSLDGAGLSSSSPEPAGPSMIGAAAAAADELAGGEGMRGAQMLVWLGDFNYRIDGAYEAVKEHAIRNELGPLLEMDQCRREMAARRIFHGLREGTPSGPRLPFRPTYKFDKASLNPFAYDSSDKQRVPAWCDRIFYRGSQPFPTPEPEQGESVGVVDPENDVAVTALEYNCWPDVRDSDHKPVYAVLEAELPITDQAKKRALCSQLLKQCTEAAGVAAGPPRSASLRPDHIKLHPDIPNQMVLLQNEGTLPLLFSVVCDRTASQSGGAGAGASSAYRPFFGGSSLDEEREAAAQRLLQVRPVRGVVCPGQDASLQVHLASDSRWSLQGAAQPPQLSYRVWVGGEYSAGGEDAGATQLGFTATCLTD